MKHLKQNKKGSIWDVFVFLIFFFVLAVGIIAVYIGHSSLSSSLGQVGIVQEEYQEEYERYIERPAKTYSSYWDGLLVIIYFGIFFVVCILAWYIPNLTIFTIIYWNLGFFLVIAGVFLSFAYTQVLETETMQPYTDAFPFTLFYFKWAWLFWIFKVFTVGILLYANPGDRGGSIV